MSFVMLIGGISNRKNRRAIFFIARQLCLSRVYE